MDVSIILVGVAILIQLVMLYVLMDIATSLRIERRYRLDREVLLRRLWFRAHGQYIKEPHCECSQESPCMGHYRFYQRWCSGATEADVIGNAITVRLKE
ncbi:MAG TPA: hypothetical protein VI542_27970 [Candidatus Tectomicrobia bacterium]